MATDTSNSTEISCFVNRHRGQSRNLGFVEWGILLSNQQCYIWPTLHGTIEQQLAQLVTQSSGWDHYLATGLYRVKELDLVFDHAVDSVELAGRLKRLTPKAKFFQVVDLCAEIYNGDHFLGVVSDVVLQ